MKQFCFSIRDLCFVVVIACLTAGWLYDRHKIALERSEIKDQRLVMKSKRDMFEKIANDLKENQVGTPSQ